LKGGVGGKRPIAQRAIDRASQAHHCCTAIPEKSRHEEALGYCLFLAALAPVAAMTSDTLVKFKGGIGVIPVSSVAGNASATGTFSDVNRNTVRTVNPPGQIWTIADLKARVKVDGSIKVDGRGCCWLEAMASGPMATRACSRR
jgi:hypothetical protein